MEPDRWLTVSEVARLLGVSRSTVWRMTAEELPFVQTQGGGQRRGHRRYRAGDVSAYRSQGEATLEDRVADLEERVSRLES